MSSTTNNNNEKKNERQASIADGVGQPPRKKVRSTVGLDGPMLRNFECLWAEGPFPEDSLCTAGSLFGVQRSWFVRESYISLFDDISNDTLCNVQIINGTGGIGKSSFLMYVLARMRSKTKSILLHYHQTKNEVPAAVFFPADGGKPTQIERNEHGYAKAFRKWYATIDKEGSMFLVDGIVSFTQNDYPNVKFVAARSPSCDIGWMRKSPNRCDRWLQVWNEEEMLSYATQVCIAKEVIHDNMFYLGGIVRYAFTPDEAEDAALLAVHEARRNTDELFTLVSTRLTARFEHQKVVDRLIHRHPPQSGIGLEGASFTFASVYVEKMVAMVLALQSQIETKLLFDRFKAAGPMRGVLFVAYAARKIADGGEFQVRQLETGTEGTLQLQKTSILQKNTRRLSKTTCPPSENTGRLVCPNPDSNKPAIDMFMLHQTAMIAYRTTVSKAQTLDIGGVRAFLGYFDSVCAELFPSNEPPPQYDLYFAVPADVYDQFSNSIQSITGPKGTVLETQEATDITARVSQWVMKVE